MKCALYERVSTHGQEENYSIESQKERLEAFCKSKDWTVYNHYVDGGYSGATMDRPALTQMLDDLEEIDVVIVYKLDRLSRSQRDTLSLIEEHFLKNNVDFVSLTETIDTSTAFGKAMIGILSVFAQLERETIAERMRIGHIKRAEEGYHASGGNYDPAGYERKDGLLVIKEDEAKHIKMVFDFYEQYHSISKVQARLKELGETVWRFRRYRDILRSRLYIGEVSFALVYYKGLHDPIITVEQFERVQILINRHKGRNAGKPRENLLSGLMTCGNCGEKYLTYQSTSYIKSGKVHYRYYICKTRRFPSEYDKECKNTTWNANKLETLIMDELRSLSTEKKTNEVQEKKTDYPAMIKKIDNKMERLIDLYTEDKIDKKLLDKRIDKLDEEKRKVLDSKNRQKHNSLSLTQEEIKGYVIDLEDSPFIEKHTIVNKFIDQIIINGESIEIQWNF